IEAYLVTLRMTHEQDKAVLQHLTEEGRRLRREYDERHAFWATQPLQSDLRQALLGTSFRPAMSFFEVWEREFVPAVRAGDREKATALATGPLQQAYDEHRRGIDEVVRLATAYAARYEKDAASEVAA